MGQRLRKRYNIIHGKVNIHSLPSLKIRILGRIKEQKNKGHIDLLGTYKGRQMSVPRVMPLRRWVDVEVNGADCGGDKVMQHSGLDQGLCHLSLYLVPNI